MPTPGSIARVNAILARVIPVQQFMSQALAQILRHAPESAEKLAFAWRAAVGTAVANVTTIEIKGHILHVRTKDAAWRREIERSAGLIRNRLNTLLGEGSVKGINVDLHQR